MIISRTPYRISFFGGGTDYPAWYRTHGGSVLATTIDKYCYLTCRYLPPFFEHRIRIVYSIIETVQSVDQIAHPSVREVLRFLQLDRGIEIHHDGDLPARSGLGSSSAFTVGLLNALYALKGHMPSKQQLASESIHVEQELLRENVGSQDQVLAAYGGFNHIIFHQDGQITARPVTLRPERVSELSSHLMLVYTGIRRTASNIAGTFVADLKAKENQLRTMSEMVDEALCILNTGVDIARFGHLLHQSWQLKRSLSNSISNSRVEDIYTEAQRAGALGGKLIGAGGGGFLLLFVPPAKQKAVRDSLNKLVYVPVKFENSGSQIILFNPEEDFEAEERSRASQSIRPFEELSQIES